MRRSGQTAEKLAPKRDEKIVRKVLREFRLFKREMLRKSKQEIWEASHKIYFYGCVMEYFRYGKDSVQINWDILEGMRCPIWEMWDYYLTHEYLGYSTWDEIEALLCQMERDGYGRKYGGAMEKQA